MGIKGLSKVIADIAPGAVKSQEMKVNSEYFGMAHLEGII